MKKFTKICLILSSVFFSIGIILVIIGANFGGTDAFKKLLYHNAFSINPTSFWDSKEDLSTSSTQNSESVTDYKNSDSTESIADHNNSESTESVADNPKAINQSFSMKDIQNLNFDAMYGEIYFTTSDKVDEIQVTAQNTDSSYEAKVTDHTLSIISKSNHLNHSVFHQFKTFGFSDENHPIIKITFPSNFHFMDAKIHLNAGYIQIDTLYATQLDLHLNAGLCSIDDLNSSSSASVKVDTGKFEVKNGDISNLDLSCGAGQAVVSSTLNGKTTLNCSVGEIILTTPGALEDFNYAITCDVGSIDVGAQTYSGLSLRQSIDHNASKSFDLTCNVGHIKVSFK